MKWLALLFILINVAVYLWVSGTRESVAEIQARAKPDVNKEGMLLLREVQKNPVVVLDTQQVAAVAEPQTITTESGAVIQTLDNSQIESSSLDDEPTQVAAASNKVGNEQVINQGVIDESGNDEPAQQAATAVYQRACFRIGPFTQEKPYQKELTSLKDWLADEQIAYTDKTTSQREIKSVRLYLGPFASKADTVPTVESLAQKNIEYFAYQSPEKEWRVSLGYFSQQALALRYRDTLAKQNIKTLTENTYVNLPSLDWVEMQSRDKQQEEKIRIRDWQNKDVKTLLVDCAVD